MSRCYGMLSYFSRKPRKISYENFAEGWIMRWITGFLAIYLFVGYSIIPSSAVDLGDSSMPGDDPAERVLLALENCSEEVDLSDASMTVDEGISLYRELLLSQPQLFHVGNTFSYAYTSNGMLTALYPSYVISGTALQAARHIYISHLDAFQAEIKKIPWEWSDFEKVLYIHDHLASLYTYSPQGEEIYDVYGMLTQGHGVCQGFALAFVALGRLWNLEVDVVTSLAMDHAWNHVCINGLFYHVDVTRDLPAVGKSLTHDRFLMSDTEAASKGYAQYSCANRHQCSTQLYDGEYEISILERMEGRIYPIADGWIGYDPQIGLQAFAFARDEDSTSLSFMPALGLDVNGDEVTTVGDMILLECIYPGISQRNMNAFRHYLLTLDINEDRRDRLP